MKLEDRDRIIEILKFQGEMIGNDSDEAIRLIKQMKQVGVSWINETLEDKIKNDIHNLCVLINYSADEETNKCRKMEVVAMRDAICRVICDKYYDYEKVANVAAGFFGKDRTSGYQIESRTKQMLESKDRLFMYYYNSINELQ